MVSDIDKVYETLRGNLKKYYGKIPISGLPRFSKLNKTTEDRRFNITDPSGNTLIVGEPFVDSTTLMDEEEKRLKSISLFEEESHNLEAEKKRFIDKLPIFYNLLFFL